MKKVKTWLPLFQGFYSTIFEPDYDCEIEYVNESREELGLSEIDFDDIEWNFKDYENNLVETYAENVLKLLSEFVEKITVEKIVSPTYYNYSNDAVDIIAEINVEKIKNYVEENLDSFQEYLQNHYTSRRGFRSGQSNRVDDWMENFNEVVDDDHRIGSVLNFIANMVVENKFDFDMEVLENCEVLPYAENYEELTSKEVVEND